MRKLRIPETSRDYHSPVLRTGLYLGLALPALIRCCEIGEYRKVSGLKKSDSSTNFNLFSSSGPIYSYKTTKYIHKSTDLRMFLITYCVLPGIFDQFNGLAQI